MIQLNINNCIALFNLVYSQTDVKHASLEIIDNLSPEKEVQKIPKIIHTIWIDIGRGNEVLPKYEQNIRKLKQLHSGWSFKNWTEQEIIELIQFKHPYFLNTFLSYDVAIKKHDSARFIILDIFGGIYIDHDFIALKNLEPLLKFYELVLGNEEHDRYSPSNAFIGSVPNHPFLKRMIREMNNSEIAQKFVLEATGCEIMKRVLSAYINEAVKIYTPKFFFPLEYWNKSKFKNFSQLDLKNEFPESYLIHEYDTLWM